MEYQATAKYLRHSPRKLRVVADSIRKLTPVSAIMFLRQLPKRASGIFIDVIQSAFANARQKTAATDALKFKYIVVSEGPVMKRWRAVSRGQAHAYKKRMSHIKIVLTDEASKHDVKSVAGDRQMST